MIIITIILSVFEVFNACQCFAMPAMLSAGKNDSPLDLVKWKAYLVSGTLMTLHFIILSK